MKIPANRVINYLGKATFMVYLIHENAFFQSLYNQSDWIGPLHESSGKFLLKGLVWTLAAFGAGTAVYTLYLLIIKLLGKSRRAFLRR